MISVGGFVDERIGPGGLYIGATVRPGKKADDVEAAIYAEIDRLQQQPIAEWELEKAKNTTRFGYLQSIRSAGLARRPCWARYTVKFNDPGLINTRLAGFDAVTRADVQRVAKKYLQATNRTVIVTNPAPPRRPRPAREASSHETLRSAPSAARCSRGRRCAPRSSRAHRHPQAPDSLQGVQLKGKAPVNPQTLRVVLPRAQEATLVERPARRAARRSQGADVLAAIAADRRRSRRSAGSARPGDGDCRVAARGHGKAHEPADR